MTSEPDGYGGADGLRVEVDGSVLRLELDRPDKRNAMNDAMFVAMADALDAAAQDESIRVAVITAAGDHFCAGADIVARNAPGGARPRVGSIQRRVPTTAHRLIPTMLRTQVPIVCRVQGWAAGIGLQIALASDFAICADDGKLWEPFVARGFTPDSGATWLLPRLGGPAIARRMLLLAERVGGREAADHGLVHAAVPAAELDAEVETMVERLAAAPTVAVGITKRLLLDGATATLEAHLHDEVLGLELSSRTEDFTEGFTSWREGRDPEFGGR